MQDPSDFTLTLKVYYQFPHALYTLAWSKDHLEIKVARTQYWVKITHTNQLHHLRAFFPALMKCSLQGRFRGDLQKTASKQLTPSFAGAAGFSHQAPSLSPEATSVYRLRNQGANFTIRFTIKKTDHERNHHHPLVLS